MGSWRDWCCLQPRRWRSWTLLSQQTPAAPSRPLAYKRFQNIPLYLEWAPAGIFRADAPVTPLQPVPAQPDKQVRHPAIPTT